MSAAASARPEPQQLWTTAALSRNKADTRWRWPDGRPVAVLCDFDGTITERDVIVMVLEQFAPPEWKPLVQAILTTRTLTLREGFPQAMALLKTEQSEAITQFIQQNVRFRPGFERFIDRCHRASVPFYVVSGGLDVFIQPVLARFSGQYQLASNLADLCGEHYAVSMPYSPTDCSVCGNCACCKIQVMDRFPKAQWARVVIGDSLTDLGVAQAADWVYAACDGPLKEDLRRLGIPHTEFATFDDLTHDLSARCLG